MEYELLKFFVENQENVWSREELLEKVWGYDYFGGARTVDVHVRRPVSYTHLTLPTSPKV